MLSEPLLLGGPRAGAVERRLSTETETPPAGWTAQSSVAAVHQCARSRVSTAKGASTVFFDFLVPMVLYAQIFVVLSAAVLLLAAFFFLYACDAVLSGLLLISVTPPTALVGEVISAIAAYWASVLLSGLLLKPAYTAGVPLSVAGHMGAVTASLSSFLLSRVGEAVKDAPAGYVFAAGLVRSASRSHVLQPGPASTVKPQRVFRFLDSFTMFLFSSGVQTGVRTFLEVSLDLFEAPYASSTLLRTFLSSFLYSMCDCFLVPLACLKFSSCDSLTLRSVASRVLARVLPSSDTESLRTGNRLRPSLRSPEKISRRRLMSNATSPSTASSHGSRTSEKPLLVFQRRFSSGLSNSKSGAEAGKDATLSDNAVRPAVPLTQTEPNLPSCFVRALQDSFCCTVRESTSVLHAVLRPASDLPGNDISSPFSAVDTALLKKTFEESLLSSIGSVITSSTCFSRPSPAVVVGSLSGAIAASFLCSYSVAFYFLLHQVLPRLDSSPTSLTSRSILHSFLNTFCSSVWMGCLEASRRQLSKTVLLCGFSNQNNHLTGVLFFRQLLFAVDTTALFSVHFATSEGPFHLLCKGFSYRNRGWVMNESCITILSNSVTVRNSRRRGPLTSVSLWSKAPT